jgi:hypothetical protein
MIRSFRCRDTARLFADEDVPRFGSVARVARRKLIYLDAATAVGDLRVPPATDLRRSKAIVKANGRSGSMTNGVSASSGTKAARMMLKSLTATEVW